MSEARKRILNMLAQGKITVDQSEELLAALEADEKRKESPTPGTGPGPGETGGNGPAGLGLKFNDLADEIHKQVNKAIKSIQPQSQELKNRLKGFGEWVQGSMDRMVSEFQFRGGDEAADSRPVEFMVPAPDGLASCRLVEINHLFGSVVIRPADVFGLKVKGRVGAATLGELPPLDWFLKHGMAIRDQRLFIGIGRAAPPQSALDLELFLPLTLSLAVKTLSAPLDVGGGFRCESIETVSGPIRLAGPVLEGTMIDSVSGDITIEGGTASFQAKTTSGDLILRRVILGAIDLQSVSGDVQILEAECTDQGRVTLSTTSGDIHIDRPHGTVGRIEARTRTGMLQIQWAGTSRPDEHRGLILETGIPGALFTLESISGNILFG